MMTATEPRADVCCWLFSVVLVCNFVAKLPSAWLLHCRCSALSHQSELAGCYGWWRV